MYYLDESGFDPRDEHTRGWALSSERLSGFKTGKRSLERISVIAAYQESELIAPMTYEGTLNTELFVTYLKKCLFPTLPKGSCVIMDNATPHKSAQVLKIAEKFGCIVLYLPPYSPDLNPIEKFWANMKRWIRSNVDSFGSLLDSLYYFFNYAISS